MDLTAKSSILSYPNQLRPTRRVLVLGGDTRSFLSVVRSLGRAGLTVDSAWTSLSSLSRRSRYLQRTNDDLPSYSPTDRQWLQRLCARVAERQYDLVIPTNDPTILPLQANRSELDLRRFYLLEPLAFDTTYDKTKTYDLALSERVPVPPQIIAQNVEDAGRAADRFGFPLVVKPLSSFRLENATIRKQFVRRVASLSALHQTVPAMLELGNLAIQPFFAGVGVGIEVLARAGKILACFQHLRIHEPPQGGGSSYRKSVEIDADLWKATARMIRALSYTGVAMVEFRRNPATGEFILVEINGRFWGSLPLAIAAGADFPLWLYQMWVEGRENFPVKTRTEIYCRNVLRDCDWFGDTPFGGLRNKAWVATRELVAGLWRIATLREHFDSFSWDDRAPGFSALLVVLSRLRERFRKFCSSFALQSGLKGFMRRRCIARLRSAKTLLFVCKGNICRGPFAAAIAKRLLPGLAVHSAGYYSVANRRSPGEAVTAAARFGIDLGNARSSVVSHELLRTADVVFVFDYENYRTLRQTFNVPHSRIAFLGLFDDVPGFLNDPYGRSLQEFISAYSRISRALENLGQALRGVSAIESKA